MLTVATPSAKAADPITVTWTGAPGYKCDWIGVDAAGDPNLYHCHQMQDTGDHELRLLSDDHCGTQATALFTITD